MLYGLALLLIIEMEDITAIGVEIFMSLIKILEPKKILSILLAPVMQEEYGLWLTLWQIIWET